MFKAVLTLITGIVLCAPAFADDQSGRPPKGKRPAVQFGARDIQSSPDNSNTQRKPAPAATPAATAKPAKSGPSTKNY
jgi:hypothetical protein